MKTLNKELLEIREGLTYETDSSEPFTGIAEDYTYHHMSDIWTLHGIESYKKGKKHGPWKLFHDDGSLRVIAHFKDNKKDGIHESYSAEGNLMYRCSFRNNKEHGIEERFDSSGQMKSKIAFSNGKKLNKVDD